jgi:hypothetical protein
MSQINNFPNNSNINYAGGPINTEQIIEFDYYKCHARLAKDLSKQCKNSQKVGLYCKIHSNVDDVLSILNTVESNKKSTTKISKEPNKLRKNKIEATQVKFSAENYNNDEDKYHLIDKLKKNYTPYII